MSEDAFHSIVGRWPCQVQWGDCDPAGVLFYPTYFRWVDAATWSFLAAVGYGVQRMRAERLAMPVVAVQSEFAAVAQQGDRCEVLSRIARFGGKSFEVAHEIAREDGTALARIRETRVWARFEGSLGAAMKAEVVPEAIRALFRA